MFEQYIRNCWLAGVSWHQIEDNCSRMRKRDSALPIAAAIYAELDNKLAITRHVITGVEI